MPTTSTPAKVYVLSIYYGHNATAALLKDGQIVACISEERFTGIKNFLGFPAQSIHWCLEYAGITAQQLDLVVLPTAFGSPVHASDTTKQRPEMQLLSVLFWAVGFWRKAWGQLVYYWPQLQPLGSFWYTLAANTIGKYTVEKDRTFLSEFLKISLDKIIFSDHHHCHAATAYYASPYNQQKALVLTLDAEGGDTCATVNIYLKGKQQLIARTSREHSLGWIYLYVTQYLGMKPMEHEYKVMGLAPYAKEKDVLKLYKKIQNIITLDPTNPLRFKAQFNTQDTLLYLKKEMASSRFDNIAGAFQKLLEERITAWVEAAVKQTGISTIACAGGVFMNVKVNQKISELKTVKKCFFTPSAGDESLPIGGCYLGYLKLTKNNPSAAQIKPIADLYWGAEFSHKQIETFLTQGKYFKKYSIQKISRIEKKIAQLLAQGKVVARMAGRMEWGARALGNRSIMAHPQHQEVVMIINEQMKDRDFWMPFAPSILTEKMSTYCHNPKHITAPYMTISFDTTPEGKKLLKAAMHAYDFTVRPQEVSPTFNPKYYQIIKEFERITKIGAILNTSFNLHGLPIVLGPAEALYAFEHSGLEYLALENYLIQKKN